MRVLYLDCGAGAAGDMFLGALLDLGVPEEKLQDIMGILGIEGEISVGDTRKGSLRGKKVEVRSEEGRKRKIRDIEEVLENSSLGDNVRDRSRKALRKLAEVESELHGEDVDSVHFHELGNVDTIIDIAGTFSLLEHLNPDRVYSSPVNLGRGGKIQSEHGWIPNPAPATVELLEGVPTYSDVKGEETVTPTGAVLLDQIVDVFDEYPPMEIERVGYGAGEKDLNIPNLLRIMLGRTESACETTRVEDEKRIVKVEANLDDCNPELLANAVEKLLSKGAIDVWQTPIQMKKNRSGVKLVALCEPADVADIENVIFEETTSLGYRYQIMEKRGLKREVKELDTKYGRVKVKFGFYGDRVNIAPEFESCRKLAECENLSLKEVYREAKKAACLHMEQN